MASKYLSAYLSGLASGLIDDTGVKRKIIGLINGYGGGGSSSTPGYANLAAFPVTGSTDKLYLAEDTGTIYYWDGTTYVAISGGGGSSSFAGLTGFPNANVNLKKQVVPTKVIYLSQYGIPDDADINIGSTSFGTDARAAIQAIYDLYSTYFHLEIHWDVHCSISAPIRYGSNTDTIFSNGCGVILRNNSDCPCFLNKNPSFTPGTYIDKNISFSGLGIINGNSYQGTTFMQQPASNTYGLSALISMYGVQNVRISNLTLLRNRDYMIHCANAYNVIYEKLYGDTGDLTLGDGIYRDGLHFDGNVYHGVIRDCIIIAADDGIALNADDSWGSLPFYTTSLNGPQDYITIDNITLLGKKGIRLQNEGSRQDHITISNIKGSVLSYWLVGMGSGGNNAASNFGTVIIRDCNVRVTQYGEIPSDATWNANCDNLLLDHICNPYVDVVGQAKFLFNNGGAATIKLLTISNYVSDVAAVTAYSMFYNQSGNINELIIINPIVRRSAISDSPLFYNSGVINTLHVVGGNLKLLYNGFINTGQITYINSTGMVHINNGSTTNATFVNISGTPVTDICMSGYTGYLPAGGTGTFTTKRGDAFATAMGNTL